MNLPTFDSHEIGRAIDENFESQIDLLQRLVRAPSLRGQENAAQEIVAGALTERGYAVERFGIDMQAMADHPAFSPATIDYAGAFNVVGRKEPRSNTGRSLALNAHIDVVPTADPSRWRYPPFSATRDGDWLYGRGAGDMKAGLVANIFAFDAIEKAGYRLTAPVQVQSVLDEEVTGNGAAAAIARGCTADAVLIPEPTDEQLVSANSGVIKFRITVHGVPAHPREAESGVSAIDAGLTLIGHLKRLAAKWNDERLRHPGFEDIANPASLNIGTISGGEWMASVPFACSFEGRIGFYPGDDPRQRAAEFEAFVAEVTKQDRQLAKANPQIEWTGVMQTGYRLQTDCAAAEVLQQAHRLAHDAELGSYVMTCYLDAALFAVHANMPALVYGPVSENIHGIDERVSLSSLRRVTKTIALFAAAWCGVERAD